MSNGTAEKVFSRNMKLHASTGSISIINESVVHVLTGGYITGKWYSDHVFVIGDQSEHHY